MMPPFSLVGFKVNPFSLFFFSRGQHKKLARAGSDSHERKRDKNKEYERRTVKYLKKRHRKEMQVEMSSELRICVVGQW